jgi:hypothetical protein
LDSSKLFDGKNCESLLTCFGEVERGPGRPVEIDDDALRRALVDLRFVLEQNWGQVGWDLKQAKSDADIRSAFAKIEGPNTSRLDRFRHYPTQTATVVNLKELRKENRLARIQARKNYESFASAQVSCEQALSVEAVAEDNATKERIQSLKRRRALICEQAEAEFQASSNTCQALQVELDEKEAFFAQSQLLNFIHHGRREFNPQNLAMAMAGQPFISAEVSCQRCRALKDACRPGLTYEVFRSIAAVFSPSTPSLNDGLSRLKESLPYSGDKTPPHIVEILENWYFIRNSIAAAYSRFPLPRGFLPYLIFAEYQGRVRSPSQVDIVLAREYAL